MEKKYNFEEEPTPMVNEPMAEYGMDTEMEILPPLTEEELAECITREELLEAVFAHIDELFSRKK